MNDVVTVREISYRPIAYHGTAIKQATCYPFLCWSTTIAWFCCWVKCLRSDLFFSNKYHVFFFFFILHCTTIPELWTCTYICFQGKKDCPQGSVTWTLSWRLQGQDSLIPLDLRCTTILELYICTYICFQGKKDCPQSSVAWTLSWRLQGYGSLFPLVRRSLSCIYALISVLG